MRNIKNAVIIAAVVVAAAAALLLKQTKRTEAESPRAANETAIAPAPTNPAGSEMERATQSKKLPRLVDLGAHACIPCKMMSPILEELKTEYASVFATEFIDVWQNADAARRYGIRVIPTQIFLDAEGRELFRHEGFFGKEDILAKWKELGVNTGAN